MSMHVECEECNGRGSNECEECSGRGEIKCDTCCGTGEVRTPLADWRRNPKDPRPQDDEIELLQEDLGRVTAQCRRLCELKPEFSDRYKQQLANTIQLLETKAAALFKK